MKSFLVLSMALVMTKSAWAYDVICQATSEKSIIQTAQLRNEKSKSIDMVVFHRGSEVTVRLKKVQQMPTGAVYKMASRDSGEIIFIDAAKSSLVIVQTGHLVDQMACQ